MVARVACTKFLGVLIDEKLSWANHIKSIKMKNCKGTRRTKKAKKYTVKPVHTGMPAWGPNFIPVWTGLGLDSVFAFGEEQTTITCTNDMRVIIQGASSVGLQMIGGCMQIN